MKKEYRPSDVAKFYNLSRMAVNKWIRSGKLPVYETGGGHYRISRENLKEFIKNTGKPLPKDLESNKYRILIVDDEKNIHKSVKAMLEDLEVELEIESAFDGFEAGMKIIEFQPHLVILDAIMPGADGDRVVKLIRSNESLEDIKILVFTGYPGEGKKLLKLPARLSSQDGGAGISMITKASKKAEPEPFRRTVCNLLNVKYTKTLIKA